MTAPRTPFLARLTAILLGAATLGGVGLSAGAADSQASAACSKVAAPGGSDSAAGSVDAPYRSAQTLVDALAPGETGCLRGGSYDDGGETYVLAPSEGGRDGAPITIRSYPGERAKLVGIVKLDADDVTLSDLDFEGTGEQNTIKIYAEDVVVEDSDITNASRGGSCMMIGSNGDAGPAVRTSIRRNLVHDCGSPKNVEARDHGIYTAHMLDGEIVDNVIYNPAAYAITLYPNAHRNRVAHNVIDGASVLERGGIVFGSDDGYASTNNVVEQNVIAHAETYGITTAWGGDAGHDNLARDNCVWDARIDPISSEEGFTASGNTLADPDFVARSARDYRLGGGSPCLPVVGYDTAAKISGKPAAAAAPATTTTLVVRPTKAQRAVQRRAGRTTTTTRLRSRGRKRRAAFHGRVSGARDGVVVLQLRRYDRRLRRWRGLRSRRFAIDSNGSFRGSVAFRPGRFRAVARYPGDGTRGSSRSKHIRFRVFSGRVGAIRAR